MDQNQIIFTDAFNTFITDSYKGKRHKGNGRKIKPQTIKNYEYVLKYLEEYEELHAIKIRIICLKGNNKRQFMAEKRYWQKFYRNFTSFLYSTKNCFDNYVGMIIKIIRAFFNYLNRELGVNTGGFHKSFYVNKEDIPIVTLLPEQLQYLIYNTSFSESLSVSLNKAREVFVFGCTVGLRVSDLFTIKYTDIEYTASGCYLPVLTGKTGSYVRLKLPAYAIDIISKFKKISKKRKTIFPRIPSTRFNNQIKELAEIAGWCHVITKSRTKRGKMIERKVGDTDRSYRFCDLISSHTMRRTAITTMLMLGMKEHSVRKISGHSENSKSFYKYVNYSQSFIDNEMDKVFEKLVG